MAESDKKKYTEEFGDITLGELMELFGNTKNGVTQDDAAPGTDDAVNFEELFEDNEKSPYEKAAENIASVREESEDIDGLTKQLEDAKQREEEHPERVHNACKAAIATIIEEEGLCDAILPDFYVVANPNVSGYMGRGNWYIDLNNGLVYIKFGQSDHAQELIPAVRADGTQIRISNEAIELLKQIRNK